MDLSINNGFLELSYENSLDIDGGGFYEIFMRGCEIAFVATTTAIGAAIGSGAGPAGTILGGSAGAVAGEAAWEWMFGNSLAGNLL